MAENIDSHSLSPRKSKDFPKIAAAFDSTIYFVERLGDLLEALGHLLLKSKHLLIGLALTVLLVVELIKFIQFLLSAHHGSP